MNLIVLALTYSLHKCQVDLRRLRMLLAGICGTLIMALLVLFAPGYGWMVLGTAFLAVPFMLLVAFGWNGGKDFLVRLLLSWFAVVVLNGSAEALQNLTGMRALGFYGAILVLPLVRGLIGVVRNSIERQGRLYEVRLCHGGRQVEGIALFDSGNLLTTADGEPVHIVSPTLLSRLELGEGSGLTMIPFQSLGAELGWIRIVRIERVQIGRGENVRILTDVWLGKSEEGLFRGKNYQMLLNGVKGVIP